MEQMPSNTPIMESKPGPAGWIAIWIKAVTQPNEQTFVDITESPDVSAKTAYIWVFIVGTLSGVIQAIASSLGSASVLGSLSQIPQLGQYFPRSSGGGGFSIAALIGGVCASPVAGLVSVVFFALGVAIIQWIAKLFGGTGTYEKLLYAMAAITVPFTLVSAVLSLFNLIPFVVYCTGLISLGLSIYALVLQVLAVKAVNRFGFGQAVGSVFIPGCVVFIFCFCIVFGGLMLLGPVIGNVFQNINQSLAP